MIEIVGALSKIKVQNANGIHFLYLVILVTKIDMFCYCFRHAIKNALQII